MTLARRTRANAGALFATMVEVRAFELACARLWDLGLIPGEMHLGVGEEAIVAGVMAHVRDGDAIAFDHRSGPPLVARGVDLESLLLEMLGDERGLCRGRGGHMHFLAPEQLAAGTGIVGATAPLACGFALAAERLRPGAVAVAFFGDGAANQGALLEAFNLAAAWKLPVVFVCKDNRLGDHDAGQDRDRGRPAPARRVASACGHSAPTGSRPRPSGPRRARRSLAPGTGRDPRSFTHAAPAPRATSSATRSFASSASRAARPRR